MLVEKKVTSLQVLLLMIKDLNVKLNQLTFAQVLEIRSRVQQNVGELIENATHASQLAVLVKVCGS